MTSHAFDIFKEGEGRFASATKAVHDKVREAVPPLTGDRHLTPEIERVKEMVADAEFIRTAEAYVGVLSF